MSFNPLELVNVLIAVNDASSESISGSANTFTEHICIAPSKVGRRAMLLVTYKRGIVFDNYPVNSKLSGVVHISPNQLWICCS